MLKNNSFYYEYFSYRGEKAQKFKDQYIRDVLLDRYLYKFIYFTNDKKLNERKLDTFQNGMIWASHYKYFEDSSELEIKCDKYKISKKTNRSLNSITYLINSMKEIYDVACFTYENNEFMWKNYANNSKGFCICFEIIDTDKYFPVEYVNKDDIDFTKSIINSIKSNNSGNNLFNESALKVSLLPLVLKDLEYSDEKEIRLLFSPFDDANGKFNGRVYPNVKDEYQHKGSTIDYSYCNIKADKILVGNNCNAENRKKLLDIAKDKNLKVNYEK